MTVTDEMVRAGQNELYECLTYYGTLPEPQGDYPPRYRRWDDLGEIAERIYLAMHKAAPLSEDVERMREALAAYDDWATGLKTFGIDALFDGDEWERVRTALTVLSPIREGVKSKGGEND